MVSKDDHLTIKFETKKSNKRQSSCSKVPTNHENVQVKVVQPARPTSEQQTTRNEELQEHVHRPRRQDEPSLQQPTPSPRLQSRSTWQQSPWYSKKWLCGATRRWSQK